MSSLSEMIAADREASAKPFCVVGNVGTVNTGAIDDLNTLADLCEREGLWFHAGGAIGGFVGLSPQFEATKISSRTKAGLARVKAQGKTLGRPDGFTTHAPRLAQMKAEGYSQGRISRETGLAVNTVKGYLRRLEPPQS